MADRTARRVVSLPYFSFPAAADLPGVADERPSRLNSYPRRREGSIANLFRRSWWLVSKASVSGHLVAPLPSLPILNALNFSAAMLSILSPWSLRFFMPPITSDPLPETSGRWSLLQNLWGPYVLCSLLLPLSSVSAHPSPDQPLGSVGAEQVSMKMCLSINYLQCRTQGRYLALSLGVFSSGPSQCAACDGRRSQASQRPVRLCFTPLGPRKPCSALRSPSVPFDPHMERE